MHRVRSRRTVDRLEDSEPRIEKEVSSSKKKVKTNKSDPSFIELGAEPTDTSPGLCVLISNRSSQTCNCTTESRGQHKKRG